MIFDGEKKVYILSEQEYDKMFDGEAHANLELIKVRKQLQEANEVIQHYAEKNGYHKAMDYLNKWGVK